MQPRLNATYSNIFLAVLFLLLTWSSSVHGAAINTAAKRDIVDRAPISAVEVSNHDISTRDGAADFVVWSDRETLARRQDDLKGGMTDDWYTLATRATEDSDKEADVDSYDSSP